MAHRSPPIAHRWPPLPTGGPPVATAKTVTATEVATDGTVVEDRWPPMDFPGLSTRESFSVTIMKTIISQFESAIRWTKVVNNSFQEARQ